MDYEKAYKEALELARKELQACGSQDCDAARQIFRLFPELAESEDERIRKEIIEYLKDEMAAFPSESRDYQRWIAWLEKQPKKNWCDAELEKQSEEKPMKVYRVENEAEQKGLWRKFDGTWQPLFYMLTDGKCKDVPMEDNPIYREGGKRWFASAPSKETLQKWFSKRDLEELVSKGFTISEFEVVGYKKVSDFEYIFTRDNIINRNYLEVSDIYSEQKYFAPKVKPKFKVGDVVIWDGEEFTILAVRENTYRVGEYDVPIYTQDEFTLKSPTKFHEGDWIVQGCNILKIRCVGDEYYCFETVGGYVDDMLVSEIDSLYHLWTIQDAEDGDVLVHNSIIFIFMGIENGIVKGICTELSNIISYLGMPEWDNDYCPATKEQRELLFVKMREEGYEWDEEKKELGKIEKQSEQKSTLRERYENIAKSEWFKRTHEGMSVSDEESKWTEEDGKCIDNCCLLIGAADDCYEKPFKDDCIHYLQSLKERIAWKPKWTEEDEKRLQSCISSLQGKGLIGGVDTINTKWLKSLKQRMEQ